MYAFVSLKIMNRESKAVLAAWDLIEYIRGILLGEGKKFSLFPTIGTFIHNSVFTLWYANFNDILDSRKKAYLMNLR